MAAVSGDYINQLLTMHPSTTVNSGTPLKALLLRTPVQHQVSWMAGARHLQPLGQRLWQKQKLLRTAIENTLK
jgi:hypothetical protein